VDLISLKMVGADPAGKNADPEACAKVVEDVLKAVDVPLIIWGTASVEKDEEVLKKIAEECQGENLILGPVEDKNHKGIGAAAMGFGHTVISSSPIDVNLAKQCNILLENLGMPMDRIIVDPTTGGLGYGLEYSYSVMERIRMAALAQGDYSAVEERVRSLVPKAESIAISETPIEGILMVQVSGDIVYMTADGGYMFQGRVVNMDTREDLTESAKSEVRRELLAGVDTTKQISFSPEEPTYDLMVFTDIDCGYCRKLHAQVDGYNENGIAIHYMAFPRAGIGSRSYEKAVAVWCADDQQEAMTQAKLGGEPDPDECENPIAEQYQLGQALGVTGTPALLTADGTLIPGYVPPEQLRERLDKMAGTAPAAE